MFEETEIWQQALANAAEFSRRMTEEGIPPNSTDKRYLLGADRQHAGEGSMSITTPVGAHTGPIRGWVVGKKTYKIIGSPQLFRIQAVVTTTGLPCLNGSSILTQAAGDSLGHDDKYVIQTLSKTKRIRRVADAYIDPTHPHHRRAWSIR